MKNRASGGMAAEYAIVSLKTEALPIARTPRFTVIPRNSKTFPVHCGYFTPNTERRFGCIRWKPIEIGRTNDTKATSVTAIRPPADAKMMRRCFSYCTLRGNRLFVARSAVSSGSMLIDRSFSVSSTSFRPTRRQPIRGTRPDSSTPFRSMPRRAKHTSLGNETATARNHMCFSHGQRCRLSSCRSASGSDSLISDRDEQAFRR